MYAEAIFVAVVVLVTFFAMPEVYSPVLLKRKAKRVRKETGDERFWHPHEAEKIRLNNVINKYFSRPLRMLITEPVVTSVSRFINYSTLRLTIAYQIACYASFVYGILYLTLEVFPIVFREQRGYSLVVSTLPFLGLFVGVLFAVGINLANQSRYAKAVEKNNGRSAPDARLPPMVIGGVLFTAGLFFFGWTAAPEYHWILPVVAAGFIGAGFNTIFQQCINVLVDTYGLYAASATAANTFLRSLFAFGLPLAAGPMFRNMVSICALAISSAHC